MVLVETMGMLLEVTRVLVEAIRVLVVEGREGECRSSLYEISYTCPRVLGVRMSAR
jgi:hypothetical protein